MPGRDTSAFNFAVFLAPSTTVSADNLPAPLFDDPAWQFVGGYNTNTATAGRLATISQMALNGYAAGSTVDFIVRGWSANAGDTWPQALSFFNNGSPPSDMYIGQSEIGNNLVLGDGIAIPTIMLFGVGGNQVNGFNMAGYVYPFPEPASVTYLIIGAIVFQHQRRRRSN